MTDYISEYTGEEIDAGIAKANMVYNALPKVSDEGDSLTLDGTANCPMKMELKGNTEQTTYTGNNLINFPYYETTKTVNGITFTVKNDGTIHVQGTASARAEFLLRNRDINLSITEGETYTLATSGLGTIDRTLWLDIYGQTGNFLDKWALSQTTTYTSAVAQSKDIKPVLRIVVTNGATVNTDVKVWLYKGSYDETTTYEPYVGGTPSPSPDYPQDVRVVTGNNNVKVEGKNLFNLTNQTTTLNGVAISVNGSEITLNGTCNSWGSLNQNLNIKLNSNESYYLSVKNFTSNAPVNFTTPEGTLYNNVGLINNKSKITRFQIQVLQGQTYNNLTYQIQLEQGSTATTYEPYQIQTYPINLGTMELCKIGSYQDYIYKDNGKWYLHKEIGKVVLDGSEENLSYNSTTNRLQMPFNLQTQDWGVLALTLCDHFTIGDTETVDGSFNITRTTLYFKNIDLTSLNDWKTWLGSNNTTVYYVLATPTNTEITDTTLISQLNAIENAVSYDTKTNIEQENYSEPFIINAECVRSLKDIFELIGNS